MSLLAAWVLWLGMQGQKVERIYMNGDMVCHHYFPEDKVVCHADPAPAEHVFEIRTKRENNSPCLDQLVAQCSQLCDNPDHTGSMKGLTRAIDCHLCQDRIGIEFQQCQSLTRELWMDGKRLGIIKGLE